MSSIKYIVDIRVMPSSKTTNQETPTRRGRPRKYNTQEEYTAARTAANLKYQQSDAYKAYRREYMRKRYYAKKQAEE